MLINCKVELKLKWRKHCVLASAETENVGADSDIIFTIKDAKLHPPVVTSSQSIWKISVLEQL